MAGQRPLESPVGVRIPAPQQMIYNSALYILFLTLSFSPISAKQDPNQRNITLTFHNPVIESKQLNLISAGVMEVILPFLPDSLKQQESESDGLFDSKYTLIYLGTVVLLIFILIRRLFRRSNIPEIDKYSD